MEYTVTDNFTVELENLTDQYGNSCRFPVELSITSPGHGDKIAQELEYEIRLAVYEAVEEFDEREFGTDSK